MSELGTNGMPVDDEGVMKEALLSLGVDLDDLDLDCWLETELPHATPEEHGGDHQHPEPPFMLGEIMTEIPLVTEEVDEVSITDFVFLNLKDSPPACSITGIVTVDEDQTGGESVEKASRPSAEVYEMEVEDPSIAQQVENDSTAPIGMTEEVDEISITGFVFLNLKDSPPACSITGIVTVDEDQTGGESVEKASFPSAEVYEMEVEDPSIAQQVENDSTAPIGMMCLDHLKPFSDCPGFFKILYDHHMVKGCKSKPPCRIFPCRVVEKQIKTHVAKCKCCSS